MRIQNAYFVFKCLGPGWIAFRIWKSVSEKLGYWSLRIPSSDWKQIGESWGDPTLWEKGSQLNQRLTEQRVRFLFDGASLTDSSCNLTRFDDADDFGQRLFEKNLNGEFSFFSGPFRQLGRIPDWFVNPISGERAPGEVHFSKINEFGYGDVKAIWELSRFGFVFDLVRAYARTGDESTGERFWELFDDWFDHNPPFTGVHWKCGQESGLRMIAVVFAYFSFRHLPSFTGQRATRLMQFLAATGLRIERHISYAISQKNNHGISEAIALWSLGVLFPNMKRAGIWKEKGARVLARLCKELIYEDGGFCQHSANYHRLLLHLLAWTIQLARVNQIQLPDPVVARFEAATDFLFQLMDQNSGNVPRYGNDDGALLFPLSHSDYQDFRPVINLCFAVIDQSKQLDRGAWDEDLFWFGLDQLPVADGDQKRKQERFVNKPRAGCHVLRGYQSFALIRAGKFIHRPAQLDMLHVDIWADGNNLAIDPGTYSYNGSGIWKSIPFSTSRFHNSVTVDDREFARRVSKFLFVPWPESNRVCQSASSETPFVLFRRNLEWELDETVVHWRLISCLPDENWMVLDRLIGGKRHDFRLHWLLGGEYGSDVPATNQVSMQFKNGNTYHMIATCNEPMRVTNVVADPDSGRGYFAPRYFELSPALSMAINSTAQEIQFVSYFGRNEKQLQSLSQQSSGAISLTSLTSDADARTIISNFVKEKARVVSP